ncbi:hypothetical protein G6F16_001978 [Rhizopus arrhizus]|nr:hypothetical protein G6F24_010244 [Rhizopus arrhizus]KAG0784071.1 hypothetical protein G6F21_010140 [Rhizopus arrhizus]KAG0799713.1 hypothetical protein G6F22_002951 [Rhizopus arrhizus]KAG0819176.1 hypothetical protein G6F20_000975 [Rhizopus arrhizus]KAG0823599.1 hypothetical protein G6F19_010778 [Rhizopus arrhizus]
MPLLNLTSSSSSKKKRPEGLDRNAKSTSSTLSLRSISRMGQSMSSMLPRQKESGEEKEEILNSIHITQKQWDQAQQNLLLDAVEVRRALDLFLDSKISDAEHILEPKRSSSLYHSLGHAFILFLKSLMTFQQVDIEAAIEALKETVQLADGFRKKDSGWVGSISSWVKGMTVQDIKNMSRLHRHAELIYAESYLLKALLCIIHDESFVSFLREGLHIRSSYNTYKTLQKFLVYAKEEAAAGKDVSDLSLDDHFTSGVSLGVGLFHILISLLPTSVMKVVEFIGFTNDRAYGLEILENVGGWEEYHQDLPPPQEADEGLRRQFCDMALLLYHVILSKLIPLSDVNEDLAERILAYNLKLYPSGVFFLYFSGKQLGACGNLVMAKSQFEKAIRTQKDWKQLQHMCYWELGLISLLQHDWPSSREFYTTLYQESNWSKAVYLYLQAVSHYMIASTKEEKEGKELVKKACEMMQKVTDSKQKIAGKSLPLEKFVARKSRKFIAQTNLMFPDLEALVAFNAIDFMNKELILENLKRVNTELDRLMSHTTKPQEALNYYDDLCLCHYLRAVLLRLLILQADDNENKSKWKDIHKQSIQCVMDNAEKIQLDHYVYYFTRYEEARMAIMQENYETAQDIVKSIVKASEKGQFNVGAGPHAKNKYSLESALLFKCHNCLTEIDMLMSQ